jgi:hypothetical protein
MMRKEVTMDVPIYVINGFGECGIDPEGSPGVGQYYVRLYDGSFDASGYDTEEEAREELDFLGVPWLLSKNNKA